MATKEELREELDRLGAEQPASDAKKEELEAAVAAAKAKADDGSSEAEEEAAEEADEERAADRAEERVEAAEDLYKSQEELEEEAEEEGADERFLQPEDERIMTGSVPDDPRSAADYEAPEEHVGHVSEAGETETHAERAELRRKVEEEGIKQEDVIDFPPPVGEREGEEVEDDGSQIAQSEAHGGLLGNTNVLGSSEKSFGQKAQFYTDGLSGAADSNLERAYELPEVLQSNDPVVRSAGDDSESSGAEKSEEEEADAEEVKSGERLESTEE